MIFRVLDGAIVRFNLIFGDKLIRLATEEVACSNAGDKRKIPWKEAYELNHMCGNPYLQQSI